MAATAELVVDSRCATGESPVWVAEDNALYWVDIPARALLRWDAGSGRSARFDAPEMIACIARRGSGWIAGMETGLFQLDAQDGELAATRLADVTHAADGMRFNDGRCDRQGRFWAGTMLMDMAAARAVGAMYRWAGEPAASPLAARAELGAFITPNGLAFSPDGRTMYLSDSHPQVQAVWAFDYDTASGTPSNRRLFIDMKPLPGRPDGATIDEDGCYWICGNDAGQVHRFTPEGRLDRSLHLPVKKPAMCAFGGADLSTLFVTSIRPAGDLSDQPLAGALFAFSPGVRGLPEPACAF